MAKTHVVVGLSGGVDSSVAALLLKEQGYDVEGIYMRNWTDTEGLKSSNCPFDQDVDFAAMTARRVGIPFSVVDLSAEYRQKVVEYLFAEYAAGRTPNPDVLCNREIKFAAFWDVARARGAQYVATGHYCRTAMTPEGEIQLLQGVDRLKDQSYFLCQVSQAQLSHALFPVGGMTKKEVRQLAQDHGLPTAERRDSYGICFVGEVNLPVFLAQRLKPKEGPIVEIPHDLTPPVRDNTPEALATPFPLSAGMGNVVGHHQGAQFFTIGQRKGLGVGGKAEPLFVVGIDTEQNIVYVAQGQRHPYLYRNAAFIPTDNTHWIRPSQRVAEGKSIRVMARLRHRQPLQAATLHARAEGLYLVFDEPQRGVTAGQFAAWYVDTELLGAGAVGQTTKSQHPIPQC